MLCQGGQVEVARRGCAIATGSSSDSSGHAGNIRVSRNTVCSSAAWGRWVQPLGPLKQSSPFTAHLFEWEAYSYGFILLHLLMAKCHFHILWERQIIVKEIVSLRRGALFTLGDMSVNHTSKNPSASPPRYVVPRSGSASLQGPNTTHTTLDP